VIKEVNGSSEWKMVRKRVGSLKPSPENTRIYRLIPDDPDIDRLAEASKKNRCDPLIVTADNFIVSGHRRRMALLLIGQKFVKFISVEVLPVVDRNHFEEGGPVLAGLRQVRLE
jgi:ParB-like chromosome segregation protein Spo0J